MSVVSANLIEAREAQPTQAENPFLRIAQQYFMKGVGSPSFWRGRPEWMTDAKLVQLQEEAEHQRLLATRRNRAYVAPPGPVCQSLVSDAALEKLIPKRGPPIKSSGYGSIIYYEHAGDGVSPHVDVGEYHWNLLVCITANGGALRLRLHLESEVKAIKLAPGEIILFEAGRIIHDRPPLDPGEQVTIAVFGFTQADEVTGCQATHSVRQN